MAGKSPGGGPFRNTVETSKNERRGELVVPKSCGELGCGSAEEEEEEEDGGGDSGGGISVL